MELNFKVYEVADVNAFACGDGSVRVFSSLMDLMDDRQLMGVIGHEIGHVVHADTKDAMKNAYMASAARNAAGSAGGTLAKLTDSQLGDLVQAFSNAQFSQKQESAADDFGFDFCVQNGLDPYSMASALEKLAELSQGSQSSGLQRMFSSHPDSQKRAERMQARAEELIRQQQQSARLRRRKTCRRKAPYSNGAFFMRAFRRTKFFARTARRIAGRGGRPKTRNPVSSGSVRDPAGQSRRLHSASVKSFRRKPRARSAQ